MSACRRKHRGDQRPERGRLARGRDDLVGDAQGTHYLDLRLADHDDARQVAAERRGLRNRGAVAKVEKGDVGTSVVGRDQPERRGAGGELRPAADDRTDPHRVDRRSGTISRLDACAVAIAVALSSST